MEVRMKRIVAALAFGLGATLLAGAAQAQER